MHMTLEGTAKPMQVLPGSERCRHVVARPLIPGSERQADAAA